MRFESVQAHAFGPFQGEALELAPGMNVVYGPNEAGKSSWHAALYAGLCGARRARGQPRKEDREFAERHAPWYGGGTWEVGAVITLRDGRRIELRHDLAGRVDSSARDADIAGRDYSNEIMSDGAPDGARWLGLDRRSFLMTACIRQADILGVLESPKELQDELQRSAATADRDGTAGEALELLRDYRAEHVGSERASTKPFRTSQAAAREANTYLEDTKAKHRAYLSLRSRVDIRESEAHAQEQEFAIARAVQTEALASETEKRLMKARENSARFPEGQPRRPSEDDQLVRQVASSLTTWDQRPALREPSGQTVPEIEADLARVDLQLAANAEREAAAAQRRFNQARELSARFPQGRPRRPSEDDQLVQQVATALSNWDSRPDTSEPAGQKIPELEQQVAEVEERLGEGEASRAARTPEGSGRGPFAALIRAIRALFDAITRLFGSKREEPSMTVEARRALEERRTLIEQRVEARRKAERHWREDTQRASKAADALREAVAAAGLSANGSGPAVEALRDWQNRRREHLAEVDSKMTAWEELQRLLGEQSLDALGEEATGSRVRATSLAARTDPVGLAAALVRSASDWTGPQPSEQQRTNIQHQIDERRREEQEYEEALATTKKAALAVDGAARRVGVESGSPDEQANGLRSWQDARSAELKEADRKLEEWEELQRLLGEQGLVELAEEAKQLRTEAEALAAEVEGSAVSTRYDQPLTEAELREAEQRARNARDALVYEQSQLETLVGGLPDVAEAEEALAAAQQEHDRVRALDHTVDMTIKFLVDAEERVHRTIAPVLAGTVREWLPSVTGGRYTDCRVDPEGLVVEVATVNGYWQQAERLSHGTAEQVYLLLRLALAQHLTSEPCPLVLDDAVAASDRVRKRDLLETLLAVSESTQVILFTHEDDVREWAQERLVGEPHKLTPLAQDSGRT